LESSFEFFDFGLNHLVAELTADRVKEVDATESASDNGINLVTSTLETDLGAATDVREDVTLAHLDQCKLDIVGMSREILETVAGSSKQAKSFVQIGLVALVAAVRSSEFDGAADELSNETSGCVDASIFGSDVRLHAILGVDGQFSAFVNWTTETTVILAGVFILSVVLGVA
jgi:hypothetical protein